MTFSLSLSLVAIVVYWLYQILSRESAQVLPASFPELVFRIARTKIIVLAAILALLWPRGEDWRALGLGRREWPKHLGIGLLFGVAMFVAFNVVLSTLMRAILPAAHTSGPSILSFFKDAGNLLVWIPIGILGGGFVEEIQRIFILTRFEQALGRLGLVLAVAKLGDVRLRPSLPRAERCHLDRCCRSGLVAHLPATPLGARADRRPRFQ
jgi:hypothetical protein